MVRFGTVRGNNLTASAEAASSCATCVLVSFREGTICARRRRRPRHLRPAALEAGVSRKWEPAVTAVSYGLHVQASSACPPAGFYLFIYYGTIPWPPGTRTHRSFRWEAFRRCSVRCARFQFQWPRTTCTTCLGWIGGRASNQSAGRDF